MDLDFFVYFDSKMILTKFVENQLVDLAGIDPSPVRYTHDWPAILYQQMGSYIRLTTGQYKFHANSIADPIFIAKGLADDGIEINDMVVMIMKVST